MASRTRVDSVERVTGPPGAVETLHERLDALRRRFPGAVFERYLERVPDVAEGAFVASTAALVGEVTLERDASVWFGSVLRGDVNAIRVGARSNIQDGCVVHLGDEDPTIIDEDVVVGHRAVLHGCHVEAGSLIGIGATILDGVRIGHGSVVAAGALVTAGTVVPPRSLVLGVPGKAVRALEESDERFHRALAGKYVRLQHNYRLG